MAINPSWVTSISMVDHSGEPTSWSVNTDKTHSDAGRTDADLIDLVTASAALINGAITRENFTETYKVSNSKFATAGQREEKFLVTYEDVTTLASYRFELPCRDTTLVPPANTDEYDITASPFAAFVTALEAYATSPDGNVINVTSIRLMGKNS